MKNKTLLIVGLVGIALFTFGGSPGEVESEGILRPNPPMAAQLRQTYGSGRLYQIANGKYEYITDSGEVHNLTIWQLLALMPRNTPIPPAPLKCSSIINYDWIIASRYRTRFMENPNKYLGFHFSNAGIAQQGIQLGDTFKLVGDTSGKVYTIKQFGHEDGSNPDTLVITDAPVSGGVPSSGSLGILC